MRVALVCPYSWSVPGGVQSHIAGLAGALRVRGHEVEIIAPADGPVELPGFVPAGRSLPIPDNGSIVRVALGPQAAGCTARLVRARGYDLVHVHEPMIPVVSLTALLAAPVPLVGTFHMYASRPRWYRPFAPLARRAIPRLGARIAVSEAALRHVARTCPGEYHLIPNGIDAAAFECSAEDRDGTRVLFVGRSEPRKGLHVLLDGFARLPGAPTLDLAGVSERDLARSGVTLPRRVAGRVCARGRVSDADRMRLLAAADVLCAPSLEGESFGIVLVEGMASGLPVVASAIPGYADVLPPECGLLVRPGDAAALAEALAGLLADGALRARLGAAGKSAARRFDWSRVCGEILVVYEEALTAAERPRPQAEGSASAALARGGGASRARRSLAASGRGS